MFYCDGIEAKKDYTRKGAVKSVHITDEGEKMFATVVCNEEKGCLEVIGGNAVVAMAHRIGVHEDSCIEFILVDDKTFIATLLEGTFYLTSPKGDVIEIDTDGNTMLHDPNAKGRGAEKVYWFDVDTLIRSVAFRINKQYSVPFGEIIKDVYLYNLRFTFKMNYTDNSTFCCNCVLAEETLGMSELPIDYAAKESEFLRQNERTYKANNADAEECDYDEDEEDVDYEDYDDDYDDDDVDLSDYEDDDDDE